MNNFLPKPNPGASTERQGETSDSYGRKVVKLIPRLKPTHIAFHQATNNPGPQIQQATASLWAVPVVQPKIQQATSSSLWAVPPVQPKIASLPELIRKGYVKNINVGFTNSQAFVAFINVEDNIVSSSGNSIQAAIENLQKAVIETGFELP